MKNEDKVRVVKVTVDYSNDTKQIAEIEGDTVHCEQFCAPLVLMKAGEMSILDFASELHQDLISGVRAVPRPVTNQKSKPTKDAPVELRVAELLCLDGWAATYEFPGYVEVHYANRVYAFGTANEVWGGHEINKEGEAIGSGWEFMVESTRNDSDAVEQVVKEIKLALLGPHAGMFHSVKEAKEAGLFETVICDCCKEERKDRACMEFYESGHDERCLMLCQECQDEFERETTMSLESDMMNKADFERLETWVRQNKEVS